MGIFGHLGDDFGSCHKVPRYLVKISGSLRFHLARFSHGVFLQIKHGHFQTAGSIRTSKKMYVKSPGV